ncbi:CAP-Gly domain-containing linker protein 1-like [Drosophila guanche]|uniref:Blast:Intracellular protein transport protein USO1 n=1 Tax=Drosophila guanche TaxID=7266 RepID=A0A3B0JC73_DROGU|nr:CAP-Gly domain-containing linker protein 1-like [Drosophila guanche]SPP79977.1 blast:Intracellular protein transport protein USO1 [Drosophila guanche]
MPSKNKILAKNKSPEPVLPKQSYNSSTVSGSVNIDSNDATGSHQSRLLQSFLKGHSKAVENVKRNNMEIAKKMHKHTKATLETKAENDHLKIQLNNAELELKELKKTLEGVKDNNNQLNEKYITVLQKYTHCEKHYDEEQSKIKTTTNQLKAEIKAKQSRIDELQRELKTVQEKCLEMSAQVVAATQTQEQQRAELQEMHSQLLEHAKEKTEATNAMQNMEQQLAAQKQLHENCELKLAESILHISRIENQLIDLEQRCCELQQYNDTIKNELVLHRNQLEAAKAENKEKDREINTLRDSLNQAENSNHVLVQEAEDAAARFATAKTNLDQVLNQEKNQLEATIARLKYELEQQNLAYGDMATRNAQEVNDIHVMLSDLQDRLNKSEQHCREQELTKKQLDSGHQMATRRLQQLLKAANEQLNEQSKQNQALVSQQRDEVENHKETIKTLQAKLEQHESKVNAQQQQIQRLEAERDTLEVKVAQLLAKTEEIVRELTTAKSKFKQELEFHKDTEKQKMASLQMELSKKKDEIAELERKKDGIIAELKFKMNRIGSVFEQPVGSVLSVRPEPTTQTRNPESLQVVESPPATSRKRFAVAQRIEAISDSSDFLSDSELAPLPPKVKPQNKRGYAANAKRARLNQNQKENNDIFDKLKEGALNA